MPANAPPRAPGELAEIEAILRDNIVLRHMGMMGEDSFVEGFEEAAAAILAALRASGDGGEARGTGAAAVEGYRYSVVLKWSDEDQAFIGRVPELPGCCFCGDTQVDAIGEAASAIACWIEAAEAAGNPIPPATALTEADLTNWTPALSSPTKIEGADDNA